MENIERYLTTLELSAPDESFRFPKVFFAAQTVKHEVLHRYTGRGIPSKGSTGEGKFDGLMDVDGSSADFDLVIESDKQPEASANDSGFLNFTTLQSFVAGISDQRKEYVLNSTLLAQRNAATPEFNDPPEYAKRNERYFKVLTDLGWVIQGSGRKSYKATSSRFELESAILEILSVVIPGNYVNLVKKSWDSLKSLASGDKKLIAFNKFVTNTSDSSFQLGCAEEQNGSVVLSMTVFVLKSQKTINQILFYSSEKSEVELEYETFTATLNEVRYSKEANDVARRVLEKDITDFIAQLDIAV